MDISTCCDQINQNVGSKIVMELQRYGSETIEKIKGVITSAFSNDPTPDCKIETEAGKIEEVLLGEVRTLEFIS